MRDVGSVLFACTTMRERKSPLGSLLSAAIQYIDQSYDWHVCYCRIHVIYNNVFVVNVIYNHLITILVAATPTGRILQDF